MLPNDPKVVLTRYQLPIAIDVGVFLLPLGIEFSDNSSPQDRRPELEEIGDGRAPVKLSSMHDLSVAIIYRRDRLTGVRAPDRRTTPGGVVLVI